jgi:uncharacterized membrane protein
MSRKRTILLYLMSALYIVSGICHFVFPAVYERIMPTYIGWHHEAVLVSGMVEVLLGVLLLFPFSRRWAAWGIIILLIAVFPANIQMAVNYYHQQHPLLWLTLLRLPIQPLLIWWAYVYTKRNGD